ncbi:hypothetical protein [Geomesophilobacter sediminis]|uniref:Uncharacterized protein n=1 Tax=Geomesophilobacter sediminis TaxID=2798584 RepID=A0A8J7IVQ4_9BACT|nr:hypothetical protein [Geomesophilobacter sediminis]MBJ6723302.1 hypothetical protein [Geomesophilobacter sediminis]
MREKVLARYLGKQSREQQPVNQQKSDVMTEEAFAEKIAALPKLDSGVLFVRKTDGFEANGNHYTDPEGKIVKYGTNPVTGDVTYVAQVSPQSYVIKFMRVGSEPLLLATVDKRGSDYAITTVTGKKITGETLIPLSHGILVGRGTTGFLYTPGKGTASIPVPDGFTVAPFQNGDVEGTKYVLLERVPVEGQVEGVVNAFKNVGSAFGISKKEDYLLLNYETRKQVAIDVSMDDKNEGNYSGCRKKKFGNVCDKVEFFESLFDKYGMPNAGHYYWRISWANTKLGPVAVVTENGMTKTIAENLDTGNKATIFSRVLGINYVIVTEQADGRIAAEAKLGFSKEVIDDITTKFN